MRPSVFVSYSQPDRDCAFELVARVEAHGIPVWIAPRDVSPSADWAAEIIDAIAAARVMVLVLSASSNDSPQVRREVERAVTRQVRILPFRIDDVLPSKSLEYFLSSQHWLDAFPPPREPHYRRLCATLEAILAPAEAGAPAPAGAATPPGATSRIREAPQHAARAPAHDAAELERIAARLAEHVGPVARVLVRRAAAGAATLEELSRQLAGEIDSEPARRAFLSGCPGGAARGR
jgi:TIR domain